MIDISHIISTYHSCEVIGAAIASLREQDCDLQREYIFVDDCSSDDTIETIRAMTVDLKHVTIIQNEQNRGPSVRLNQGAAKARGRYLHFLDHDDVVPANAIDYMARELQRTRAPFIYGRWERSDQPAEALIGTRTEEHEAELMLSSLERILQGGVIRMCLMVERDAFMEAGGFDERIFIQDESLPLRLSFHARKMALSDTVVNLVPKTDSNLSDNKSQLNHDRFLANYYLLADHRNELSDHAQRQLFARCVSAGWKQARTAQRWPYLRDIFWYYLLVKLTKPLPKWRVLDVLFNRFASLTNVLRVEG